MTFFTQTDCPKSVHNCCVIEFWVVYWPFLFFWWYCLGHLSWDSDLFLFLFVLTKNFFNVFGELHNQAMLISCHRSNANDHLSLQHVNVMAIKKPNFECKFTPFSAIMCFCFDNVMRINGNTNVGYTTTIQWHSKERIIKNHTIYGMISYRRSVDSTAHLNGGHSFVTVL